MKIIFHPTQYIARHFLVQKELTNFASDGGVVRESCRSHQLRRGFQGFISKNDAAKTLLGAVDAIAHLKQSFYS